MVGTGTYGPPYPPMVCIIWKSTTPHENFFTGSKLLLEYVASNNGLSLETFVDEPLSEKDAGVKETAVDPTLDSNEDLETVFWSKMRRLCSESWISSFHLP